MIRFLTCVVALISLFALSATAQFDNTPHDQRAIGIGLSGDRLSQSHSATAILPFNTNRFSGWAGVHALRTVAEGNTLSDVIQGRIEVGTDVYNWSVNGFVDAERNKATGTDLTTQLGYYLRLPAYENNGWVLTTGAGNYIENTQIAEDLGIPDAGAVFRWFSYVMARYQNVTSKLEYTPKSDFSDDEIEIETNATISVRTNLELVITHVIDIRENPLVAGENTNSRYSVTGRLTF